MEATVNKLTASKGPVKRIDPFSSVLSFLFSKNQTLEKKEK